MQLHLEPLKCQKSSKSLFLGLESTQKCPITFVRFRRVKTAHRAFERGGEA